MFKWFLPILFIGYYTCITLFVHTHIEEGTPYVHSHPFKKGTNGDCHHHSSATEIHLFCELTSLHCAPGYFSSVDLKDYSHCVTELESFVFSSLYVPETSTKIYLRAPPFEI